MDADLLIVEELMLLLLDDDSGVPAAAGTLHYTLAGAVLVDLALRGSVEVDAQNTGLTGHKVHTADGDPPADPLLQSAFDTIAVKSRGVQSLLAMIGPTLHTDVVDRLVERGLLRRERKKFLRVFNTTGLEVEDGRPEAELRQRVRAALVDDETPDARTAAVIALLSASGALPVVRPAIAPWSGDLYRRAKEFEQGDWGADAVSTAITRTTALIAAATTVSIAAAAANR